MQKRICFQDIAELKCLIFSLLISIIFISTVSAQIQTHNYKSIIKGQIITADSIAVQYVTVKIAENKRATETDENGNFYFDKLGVGVYHLLVSGIGIENISKEVEIKNDASVLVIIQINLTENQLKEVIVKTQLKAYLLSNSSSATRSDIPVKDIPQSVQIVSSQMLKDRQAISLNEAAKILGGIVQNGSNEVNGFVMRGFSSNSESYAYDGILYNDIQVQLQDLFYNTDHVEFLKGPSSAIYGLSEPGGVINIVTKKPLPFKRYEFDATAGSYNQYRFMTDFSGPLNKHKNILYRFVAGYENTKALDRNQHIQNICIAPQIEFKPSSKTSLRLSAQYSYDDRIAFGGTGVPAFFDTSTQKFINDYYSPRTSLSSPFGNVYSNKLLTGISFNHIFSDKINFSSVFFLVKSKYTSALTDLNADASYLVTSDSIPLSNLISSVNHLSLQSSSFAEFKFHTGSLSHIMVTGIDFHFWKEDLLNAQIEQRNVYIPDPDLTWGIYNYNTAYKNLNAYNNSFAYKAHDTRAGIYVNDLINLADKWKLLAGVRYDYFRGVPNPFYPAYASLFKDTSKTSTFYPRLGLINQSIKNISLYASFTQGFFPQFFSNKDFGGPFPPEKSKQYELGTKLNLMQNNLLITAAAYSIQKYNVVVGDTIPNKARLLKHIYSKGIELSIQGKLGRYIGVMANYSFDNTKVSKEDMFFAGGNQFPGVPKNAANTWLNYEIKKTGINLGAGFNYVSSRSTYTNNFFIPAYTTVDAGINYSIKKFRLACNLYNITNEKYWVGGSSSVNIYPGNPFSFRFNINYLIE